MAYAGALFADACLRAQNGEPRVAEYAYVQSEVVPGLPFFSSKCSLGNEGTSVLACSSVTASRAAAGRGSRLRVQASGASQTWATWTRMSRRAWKASRLSCRAGGRTSAAAQLHVASRKLSPRSLRSIEKGVSFMKGA